MSAAKKSAKVRQNAYGNCHNDTLLRKLVIRQVTPLHFYTLDASPPLATLVPARLKCTNLCGGALRPRTKKCLIVMEKTILTFFMRALSARIG